MESNDAMNDQVARRPPSPWLGWIPILVGLVLGVVLVFFDEALPHLTLALEIAAAPAIGIHLLHWWRSSKDLGRLITRARNPRGFNWALGGLFLLCLGGVVVAWLSDNPIARFSAVLGAAGSAELLIDVLIGTEFRELGVGTYRWRRRWDELTGFRWDSVADDSSFDNLALFTSRRPLINFPRRSELTASVRRSQRDQVDSVLTKRLPAPAQPHVLESRGNG